MSRQLLLGSGNSRAKRLHAGGVMEWTDLVTVDIDPNCGADVVRNLEALPYPFADGEFDEIHAYDVLEHIGRQGDWFFFFSHFAEMHRLLCDGGHLFITVPSMQSPWVWGDPGHTRALPLNAFSWLSQAHYEQVGKTACTDYRHVWSGNLPIVWNEDDGTSLSVILRKEKA